jgi:colanic acid/amylovoran biosynthesis glycosyltransferase
VINTYLGRSATFVHTTLRFQRNLHPVVLARQVENLAEFPLDTVVRLLPDNKNYRRLARRAPRWAAKNYDRKLARAAVRYHCELLHAHFGWAACDSLPVREELALPLISTFYGRDLAPEYAQNYPYGQLFDEGAYFLCEGHYMAGQLVALGCPEHKVRVVKIGLDLQRFPFAPPIRSRPLVILQTARFVDKKGIDLSIQAFAAARSRLGSSELWLIGDGDGRSDLEALAVRLRCASSVRFLGAMSHAAVCETVQRAHICIQPSRTAQDGDTEGGAPTVLLEMQAIGMPIVSTRHADIPGVVAQPDKLVEEGDVEGLAEALVRLGRAPDDEWSEHARRGRALVETEHDARRIADQLESVYLEALGLERRRASYAGPSGAPGGPIVEIR